MPWDKESARKAARKGGLARAENMRRKKEEEEARAAALANMSAEEKAQAAEDRFRDATPDVAERLVQAALGEGEFSTLKPTDRLSAILRVLDYGVGKPTANPKEKPKPKEEEVERGLQVV